ncbi:archaeosortase/exosortase family protein [Mucilaginibacter sp. HMF5004]|uniref:archaeosortase/exosortase family protein n=1 Tax=Mucilaginibacter rivuli TaxID=2857527 RepID=UPI001C5D261F|nr:archaeosortase/exosortase family protein [Mucilaginibacter rivuli]MBW4891278.1 archaeosortase/exosortase family protein [Mucilaginibacter rivuli]
MSGATLQSKWNQVPKAVKVFLSRALIILVVWKILYLGFLAPHRTLDAPLTYSVASLTAGALNLYTHSKAYTSKTTSRSYKTETGAIGYVYEEAICINGKIVVYIEDACNGLELFVLYISFILILPSAAKYKAGYTILGVIAIYAVNVFRCAMVAYMVLYYPTHADFAHHYVFAFIVYAFIIALWLAYSNKVSLSNDSNPN